MSDFTETYNDSMSRYAENISKMTQAVQGIYTSESYMSMVQSARRLSEGLQGIYSNPNYIKSIQSAQKIAEAFRLSVPKVYYNQNTLEKSEGKLAKLLYRIITFIVTTFLAGYLQYASGPVYKLINKVIVKEDIDDLSKEIGIPTKGTKFTVWAKKDGYVEISYEDENGSIQGYISEVDFNNKSELVQDALDEEQVIFICKCMLSMSEYWNVDSDEAYKRLNEEFDIIKEYIIPEYDRLVELTDEELVLDIDGEYKKRQNTKIEDEFQKTSNYSDDELRFVVFCIESLVEDMNVDPVLVYDALARKSDIVDQYIIPCYETLHTQGKEYIIENLKEVMEERGITV